MKNLTVTLPEELAQWVRVYSAKQGVSMSRAVATLLEKLRDSEDRYRRAHEQFLQIQPKMLRAPSEELPKRDELYDRRGVR